MQNLPVLSVTIKDYVQNDSEQLLRIWPKTSRKQKVVLQNPVRKVAEKENCLSAKIGQSIACKARFSFKH